MVKLIGLGFAAVGSGCTALICVTQRVISDEAALVVPTGLTISDGTLLQLFSRCVEAHWFKFRRILLGLHRAYFSNLACDKATLFVPTGSIMSDSTLLQNIRMC